MSEPNSKIKSFFENRKLVALTFLPIILVGFGLLIYFTSNKNATQQNQLAEYSEDLDLPENSDTLIDHNSKLDAVINGEKLTQQQLAEKQRHMVSDDDFFSAMDNETQPENENFQEEEKKLTLEELMNRQADKQNQPVRPQTKTVVKEKVVIKEVIVEKEPEDTRRRRNIGDKTGNMGYGYSENARNDDMIKAVIHNGNKKVKSGTHIKLRVTQDSYYKGHFIKKNSYLTAVTSPKNERIDIKVTSIKTEDGYLSATLNAFDSKDGMQGVYTPASIDSEIADDTKNSALDQGRTTINIPVIGSISTSALSKKMKESGIPLKDGTQLVLKNTK